MKALYERCCGIDVHKRIVVACLKCGKKQEIREFGTTTEELRSLTEWLSDSKCQMIAMESTGSYWKPLYNIFELSSLAAIVVNARQGGTFLVAKRISRMPNGLLISCSMAFSAPAISQTGNSASFANYPVIGKVSSKNVPVS